VAAVNFIEAVRELEQGNPVLRPHWRSGTYLRIRVAPFGKREIEANGYMVQWAPSTVDFLATDREVKIGPVE
jgi:hypothetical protein